MDSIPDQPLLDEETQKYVNDFNLYFQTYFDGVKNGVNEDIDMVAHFQKFATDIKKNNCLQTKEIKTFLSNVEKIEALLLPKPTVIKIQKKLRGMPESDRTAAKPRLIHDKINALPLGTLEDKHYRVMEFFAQFMWEWDKGIYPTERTISNQVHLPRSTVKRHIDDLIKYKILHRSVFFEINKKDPEKRVKRFLYKWDNTEIEYEQE